MRLVFNKCKLLMLVRESRIRVNQTPSKFEFASLSEFHIDKRLLIAVNLFILKPMF